VRAYKNQSSLPMHADKGETHVISSILHIDHEYDDDAVTWPIEIEDYEGKIHAVDLKPGQMLFYESAKCLHGRPKIFHGKYYASVFTHYSPVGWRQTMDDEAIFVPPHWRDDVSKHPNIERLATALPSVKANGGFLFIKDSWGRPTYDSVCNSSVLPPCEQTDLQLKNRHYVAKIFFENQSDREVKAFWVDRGGGEHLVDAIAPMEIKSHRSFVGHVFHFKSVCRSESGCNIEHTVDASKGVYVVGEPEHGEL